MPLVHFAALSRRDFAILAVSPSESVSSSIPPLLSDPGCDLMTRVGYWIAVGFGSGLLRPAPGTWGSVVGLLLAWGLVGLPVAAAVVVWIALLPLAWWACRCGERVLQKHDDGRIVIDEIIAVPIPAVPLLWAIDRSDPLMAVVASLAAFGLFRLFDIWKPGPVGWCDRRPGALGVVLDDLAAGLLALLVLVPFLG